MSHQDGLAPGAQPPLGGGLYHVFQQLAPLLTQGGLDHGGILPGSMAGAIPESNGQSYSRFV
jgi:hypothetical protein